MQMDRTFLRRWLWTLLPIGMIVLIIGAIFASQRLALAAPAQPIAYSHKTHVEAGLQCLYCHTSALRSDIAGIPSVQKCIGCHTIIATENEAVQTLTSFWERGEPIPWNRVNKQPDFVFFSHQAHLRVGENCETCHGNVSQMTVAQPVLRMDMGWCLDCHEKQEETKVAHLRDCLTCHK